MALSWPLPSPAPPLLVLLSWNAVDWKGPLPSLLLGSLFAKLSWRHEVLLCAEENIAPWGGLFLPKLPASPASHP